MEKPRISIFKGAMIKKQLADDADAVAVASDPSLALELTCVYDIPEDRVEVLWSIQGNDTVLIMARNKFKELKGQEAELIADADNRGRSDKG